MIAVISPNAFYVDDNGSEPSGVIFVLAGFASTAKKWAAWRTTSAITDPSCSTASL
jgi:hypothetical protein